MHRTLIPLLPLVLGLPLGAQVPLTTLHGGAPGDSHCFAVGGVDLDGDGWKDVIVGAPFDDSGFSDGGAVHAYSGTSQTVLWSLTGASGNAWLGAALAWTGDCDGDGVADVLVGAPYEYSNGLVRGAARVHSGATGDVLHEFFGDHAFEGFGAAVTSGFDWNGDGVNDFAVGAPYDDDTFPDAGKFAVYDGTSGSQLGQVHGAGPDRLMGWSLAPVGQIGGAPSPDLAVGEPNFDGPGTTNAGRVHVFGHWGVPIWSWTGPYDGGNAGYSICGMGDWLGDGFDEVLVGIPNAAGTGTVEPIGGKTGTSFGPWSLPGGAGDWMGYSVARLDDLNGDGVTDVAIGAPQFGAGGPGFVHIVDSNLGVPATIYGDAAGDLAGWTVSYPGDMNQDGEGDILVGAAGGSGPNGTAGWVRAVSLNDCAAESYCTAGTSASGCQATLTASGTPSASAPSSFTLHAAGVEGNKDGLFFFGSNGRQASPWGNGSSYQCVVPPVKRGGLLSGAGTNGSCDGSFAQDLNALWSGTPAKNPGSGAVVQAQLWYRDPQNTGNQTTGLSNALEFTVCQ